jgi:c(7)-type cytochrome triheme protein
MNESRRGNHATSQRSWRQNIAPDVSPGGDCHFEIQPSKRAAETRSPAQAGPGNNVGVNPGFRSLRSLHPGLNSIARLAGWRRVILNRALARHSFVTSILLVVLAGAVVFASRRTDTASIDDRDSLSPPEQMQFPEGLDYGKFQHSSRNHSRLPCLLCHRRDSNAPVPKRPGASQHLPCAGCHAQQFSNNESPICTICHTDAKSGALKPFPHLKSFRMKFDHARHVSMGSVSCNTCHRESRGGVAMSIPSSFNAHTTCWRCHTPRAQSDGKDISSCGTCHQLGGYSRTPETMPAFKVSFSHAKHTKVTCNECHQVRPGQPQRRQVTTPEPLNHQATGRSQSCMTCHDGKRAFGGEDFTACKRCHTGNAWRF